MIEPKPAVLKVGGSLLDWPELPGRLHEELDQCRWDHPILVVGGGRAADLVRDLDRRHQLGPERSHALALHALDLTARLLAAMSPGLEVVEDRAGLVASWRAGRTPVLRPGPFLDDDERAGNPPLPRSWDVTTDSIAARIATRLGASPLVLLKSTPLPTGTDRADAARLGLVDPHFSEAARELPRVLYLNLRDRGPIVELA